MVYHNLYNYNTNNHLLTEKEEGKERKREKKERGKRTAKKEKKKKLDEFFSRVEREQETKIKQAEAIQLKEGKY